MRIGVVIPAYNAAAWIGDAVASVLEQTHRDWALVVVDDGSSDATAGLVGRASDPRIRLIRQENAGVSAARNVGTAALLGGGGVDACLFLDADDWLAPGALARLSAALVAAPDAVAACGPCRFIDTGRVHRPPGGDLLQRLLVRNLFANGGHLLLRAAAVHRAGGFQCGIAYGEDWEFWIRIALQGRFAAPAGRSPVLFVRRHGEGAYQRLATDPLAFLPCIEAIFGNPTLWGRLGARRIATLRQQAEAENAWVIGRELIRHGRSVEGLVRLCDSVRTQRSVRRAALLVASHVLLALPQPCRGPLRPYRQAREAPGVRSANGANAPVL